MFALLVPPAVLALGCTFPPAQELAPSGATTGNAAVNAAPAAVAPPVWPAPGSPLRVLPAPPVGGTLLLDAGHGAAGNSGNTNWRCEAEGDVMRRITDGVADAMGNTGLAVRRTRPDGAHVAYPDRLAASRGADWLVSLHSDSRAGSGPYVHPTTGCTVAADAAGFSVLWSDEGAAPLVARRRAFAYAVARRMIEAGFLPYPGLDYGGLYEGDVLAPGVFVDRHALAKRIMLLRRPPVPSVIVETHQAWDPADAARWEEPATWAAFGAAVHAAIADVVALTPK